jgi:4-hydroxy-tetrahydrodipicolinate reductase
MGRAIERAASSRGHVRAALVDRSARGRDVARSIGGVRWRGIAAAFEFTRPDAACENIVELLRRGVPVVCGTTGWDPADRSVRRAARESRAGAVIAANFSVGMSLFRAVVAEAGRRFLGAGEFDPWIAEWHHRAKRDAPSGTAVTLGRLVGDPAIASVRAGHEPGRHVVGFDGPHDAVTLTHEARGREGFAAGAVLAAEWLQGKRGLHGFEDVVDDLLKTHRRSGGTR